jgi:hypothetical protein
MARISKATREAAIDACLLAADFWLAPYRIEHPHDGISRAVDDLLSSAWIAVGDAHADSRFEVMCGYCWLEAAALLRDGWSPGDPVHLLTPEPTP